RQPGYLRSIPRPVALRPSLTTGLPFRIEVHLGKEQRPRHSRSSASSRALARGASRGRGEFLTSGQGLARRELAVDLICSRAMKILLGLLIAIACLTPASAVAQPLHLVLTPSQKPTDLLAAGNEFGQALAKLYGAPVRVTVASDYAAVIEALRNRTADLAFVHPVGYVLASREAKARIVARNLWHGKRSEEHTSELQSQSNLVCRLLLEKKKQHLA